ncbi:ZNF474 [Symbiodinium sp. CCMP2592]|nr:ZNF474 [Symbiodinium sp. CCMP2592]
MQSEEICIKEAQLRGLQDLNAAPLPTSTCRRRKPKSVTCDTCGREFTEASINLHRRKCTKLQQERKTHCDDERRVDFDSPERSPRAKSYDPAGQAEAWVVRSQSADAVKRQRPQTPKTVPCQFCGKDFLYTSIKVHQSQCGQRQTIGHVHLKRENSQRLKATLRSRDSTPRGKTPSPDSIPAPALKRFAKFVTCHVCGQLFGTKSIHCHVPRCQKLREAREAQKPIWDRQLQVMPRNRAKAEEMPTRSIRQAPKAHTAATLSNHPLAVVCHLCGRHFSCASIAIHLPRCRKMWEEREHTKLPKERRKVPQAPEGHVGSEEYNQRARIIYKEESAEACPRCGRRLADDKQFSLHLASCKINSVAMLEDKEQDQLPRGCPVLVTCHLCGKDFGTASIDIHRQQCTRKWSQREAKKPTDERRPLPHPPESSIGMSQDDYNRAALKIFQGCNMLSCKFCSRTFWDEEKFEQHVRICEDFATEAARAPSTQSPGRSPSPTTTPSPKHIPSLLCHICGKQFGTASLEIHMRRCAKKWEQRQAAKPAELRRALPQRPEMMPDMTQEIYDSLIKDMAKTEGMAAEAEEETTAVLVNCLKCGSTIAGDQFHLHTCHQTEVATA